MNKKINCFLFGIFFLGIGESQASTFSLIPSTFQSGKTVNIRLKENNIDVTKDYNFSYVDSDPTAVEMSIVNFAGIPILIPKIVGTGYTIRATKKIGGTTQDFSVSISAGEASSILIYSGNNQSASVSQSLASPLVVKVVDKNGNGVSGSTVNWSSSSGSISSSSSVSDSSGMASVSFTNPAVVGSIYINANLSSNFLIKNTFTVVSKQPSSGAARLYFSSIPSSISTDSNFSVSVLVKNALGSTVLNASNQITLGLFKNSFCTIPVTGSFSGNKTVSAENGIAAFSSLSYNLSEKIYIGAYSSGLTPVCSKSTFVALSQACPSGFHKESNTCVSDLSNVSFFAPFNTFPFNDNSLIGNGNTNGFIDMYNNMTESENLNTLEKVSGAGSLKINSNNRIRTVTRATSPYYTSGGDFTIEFDIKANYQNNGRTTTLIHFGASSPSVSPTGLHVHVDQASRHLKIDTGSVAFQPTFTPTNNVIIDNQWQHIAIVKSGTYARAFVDGALVTETTLNIAPLVEGNIGFFYHPSTGYTDPFSGSIDEFKITDGIAKY